MNKLLTWVFLEPGMTAKRITDPPVRTRHKRVRAVGSYDRPDTLRNVNELAVTVFFLHFLSLKLPDNKRTF